MKVSTSIIAGLGLIGAGCLVTPQLANAAATTGNTTAPTTMPAPAPVHSRTQAGMNEPSHHVAVLQEALDRTGAHLRIDGLWGPNTTSALEQYQRNHGLQVTGRLDPATRAMLAPIG